VEDALALHDALVRAPAGCDGQRGSEHLRDGVVTARFACMGATKRTLSPNCLAVSLMKSAARSRSKRPAAVALPAFAAL
jgi:hypothetical protein